MAMAKKTTLAPSLALACLALVLGGTLACPTSKFTVQYMTKCCDTSYHITFAGLCCKTTTLPSACYCQANLTTSQFLDKVNCVPDIPTTTTPPTTTTTPTTTTPTTTFLPQTARCPKPAPRLIGGFGLSNSCDDPGVVGFAASISTTPLTFKLCNGIFVFDQAITRRVIRLSTICYELIKELLTFESAVTGIIVQNSFNVTNTTFENTNFADRRPVETNGVMTLEPNLDTERAINSYTSSCYSIACERTSSVNITDIDFNNCTVYSYGSTIATDSEVAPNYDAYDVHVERYNGWDQVYPCQPVLDYLASTSYTRPNNNTVCFVTKSPTEGTCHKTDMSAPLMCWTKDGVDELLMGFTAPFSDCSSTSHAFIVFPY